MPMKTVQTKIDVRNFQSVFLYLQEYYATRKSNEPEFSFDVWAKELGLKSRTYLHAMVFGERPLKESLLEPLAQSMGLEGRQLEYFKNLFHYSRCKTSEQKKVFASKLMTLAKMDSDPHEVLQHFEFLSNPLLPRLQTMMSFEDSPQDSKTLAFLLGCSESELQNALKSLQEMGLLQKNDSGKLVVAKRSWFVPDSFKQMSHSEFYRNVFKEAETALETPSTERRFNSLFFALSPEEFETLLADFEEFATQQLAKHDHEKLSKRRLYQLNVNVFPTSKSFQD